MSAELERLAEGEAGLHPLRTRHRPFPLPFFRCLPDPFPGASARAASAIVTRQGGDVPPERGKRGTAPRAQRVERGPTPAPGSALCAARG
jgi:hypothetical protein